MIAGKAGLMTPYLRRGHLGVRPGQTHRSAPTMKYMALLHRTGIRSGGLSFVQMHYDLPLVGSILDQEVHMAQSRIRDPSRTAEWAWRELLRYGGHERTCAAIRLVAQEQCDCGWDAVKRIAQKQVKITP